MAGGGLSTSDLQVRSTLATFYFTCLIQYKTNQSCLPSGEYCTPTLPQLQELGSICCLKGNRKENEDQGIWCLFKMVQYPSCQKAPYLLWPKTHSSRKLKGQTNKGVQGAFCTSVISHLLRGAHKPKEMAPRSCLRRSIEAHRWTGGSKDYLQRV